MFLILSKNYVRIILLLQAWTKSECDPEPEGAFFKNWDKEEATEKDYIELKAIIEGMNK